MEQFEKLLSDMSVDRLRAAKRIIEKAINAAIDAEVERLSKEWLPSGDTCIYRRGVFERVPLGTKMCTNCGGFYTDEDSPCPDCGID